MLSTMLFHDDVVPQKNIGDMPERKKSVPPKQVKMAGQIIESLTTDWKPERYSDSYKQQVLDMIKRKANGEEIVVEEQAEEEAPADLMAALEASLEAAKKNRRGKAPARKKRKSP